VRFNLLARVSRPGFRDVFLVKRRLGGLRLILAARRHYELVILFGTGEPQLRLCRACALLLMRPVRFFVFNEFGEGFWLNRENSRACREHLFAASIFRESASIAGGDGKRSRRSWSACGAPSAGMPAWFRGS
jgi:hypothetical protein